MTNLINAENAQAVVDVVDRASLACMILGSICIYVAAFPLRLGTSKKHERSAAIVASFASVLASAFCAGTLAVDSSRKTYEADAGMRALDGVDRTVITVMLVTMLVLYVATAVIAARAKRRVHSQTSEDHLVTD